MVIRDTRLLKIVKYKVHVEKNQSNTYMHAAQIINKTKISVQKGAFLTIARTNYR